VLNRVVQVHSRPGDVTLDFFGGSGTTGVAAARCGRGFVLVDNKAEAVDIAAGRLVEFSPELVGFTPTSNSLVQAALF
jgi:site-specific DNA-methyltransferase (adenine-specific)